jgi:DUF1680 family protein
MRVPAPTEFALNLRIPRWLDSAAEISINGKSAGVPAARGTFAEIKRRWRDGDTVQLTLPLGFRAEPVDDQHMERVAVMRGPRMMVAVNPASDLQDRPLTLPGKPQPVPHKPSAFTMGAPGAAVEMIPFHEVLDETYTTYLQKA